MKYEFDFRKRKKKRIILKIFSMRNRFIRNIDKDLRIEDVENIWNDLIQNMILILYLKSINFVFFFEDFLLTKIILIKINSINLLKNIRKKKFHEWNVVENLNVYLDVEDLFFLNWWECSYWFSFWNQINK